MATTHGGRRDGAGRPKGRKNLADLASKIAEQQKALAKGKASYSRSDELLDQLEKEMLPGVPVMVGDTAYILRDKLIDRKTGTLSTRHFHGSYFRRYEIEAVAR